MAGSRRRALGIATVTTWLMLAPGLTHPAIANASSNPPARPLQSCSTGLSLVRNGNFERPQIHRNWKAFATTGERIPAWKVVSGTVDIVGTDWRAARGRQSLGVNGYGPGWLRQLVPTEEGSYYRLTFMLRGDPFGTPARSQLIVRWAGSRLRVLTVDANEQPPWRRVTVRVKARESLTRLGFRSLTKTNAGPVVDAVRVVALSTDCLT